MKYKHTAFVEALNKILAERLFRVQDAKELNDSEKLSATWVKHHYGLVDELNDMETEMIGNETEGCYCTGSSSSSQTRGLSSRRYIA